MSSPIQRIKSHLRRDSAAAKQETARLSAITEQNQLNSPFLRLPGEIRNRIYHFAMGGHEIYAMGSGIRPFVCMGRPDTQFAWNLKPIAQIMAIHLLLVCRQIRTETGAYFIFKYNTFGSAMPEFFPLLMDALTAEQKNRIEVVKMNFRGGYYSELVKSYFEMRKLGGLKTVVLRDMRETKGRLNSAAFSTTIGHFRLITGKSDLEIRKEEL